MGAERPLIPLDLDGPAHRNFRRLLDPVFAPKRVASLDPATSHSVLKHIEELNRQDGVTVMCALHFLSLARRYGTRVVALKAGRIVFTGMPHEIDEHRFKEIYGEEAVEVEIT